MINSDFSSDLDGVLVTEEHFGIGEMIKLLEKLYQESCLKNGTDDMDMKYMRSYLFGLIALNDLRLLRKVEALLHKGLADN